MNTIDLNCDMGEGLDNEHLLMPWITSANISCGFHAGNGDVIRRTIALAKEYKVKIGAHPSFRDRENFGRKEIRLSADKLYALVLEQLIKMDLIAREKGVSLHHVKPHGALYNLAAKDPRVASTIAQAVKDFHEDLVIYGLSGSHLIGEAKKLGLKTASEVFADRSYSDDGSLVPRSQPGALIEDEEQSMQQVRQMIREGSVTSVSGKIVPIVADTVCIHGDGKNAVKLARLLHGLVKIHRNNFQKT